MSENVQENKEPQSTDTPGLTPINSQEELDRNIGNRLALRYLPGCFPPRRAHTGGVESQDSSSLTNSGLSV